MRISDWSSDVCSSDLRHLALVAGGEQHVAEFVGKAHQRHAPDARLDILLGDVAAAPREHRPQHLVECLDGRLDRDGVQPRPQQPRSEEHTSELQSLMRISYAVFCLKKKKKSKKLKRTT